MSTSGVRRAAALLLVAVLFPLEPAAAATLPQPFAGSGTWISIFAGDAVWDRPGRQVRSMHRRGVRTLYLQTASSTNPVGTDLYRPVRLARFLHAAHERRMRVIAWYLPPLRSVAREHDRAMAAIRFRTARGQRFDGFALDIEPSMTTPSGPLRNDNLRRLSRRIRESAGQAYPLGAIIPSPLGMRLHPRYWPNFPYETVGRLFDVVLPMSYSTYRHQGGAATYAYTAGNIAFLRERLGPSVLLHVIGGVAGALGPRETAAFVAACNDTSVTGASLWHFGGYGPEDWEAMSLLDLSPDPAG